MATWKRLSLVTDSSVANVDVNIDCVAFMFRNGDRTDLHFVGGRSDQGREMVISVRETIEEIQMASPVRQGS